MKALGTDLDKLAQGAKADGPAIRVGIKSSDGQDLVGSTTALTSPNAVEVGNKFKTSMEITFNPNAMDCNGAHILAHELRHVILPISSYGDCNHPSRTYHHRSNQSASHPASAYGLSRSAEPQSAARPSTDKHCLRAQPQVRCKFDD